jgi:hypothetical protein
MSALTGLGPFTTDESFMTVPSATSCGHAGQGSSRALLIGSAIIGVLGDEPDVEQISHRTPGNPWPIMRLIAGVIQRLPDGRPPRRG